jgi:hypothetical protein
LKEKKKKKKHLPRAEVKAGVDINKVKKSGFFFSGCVCNKLSAEMKCN